MNKKFDRIAGTVFLLIGLFFLTESQKLMGSAYGSQVGPEAFPAGLGILLIILVSVYYMKLLNIKTPVPKKKNLNIKDLFLFLFLPLFIFFFWKKLVI